MLVSYERDGSITVVTIRRPERRNAVDAATASALAEAFRQFEVDAAASVAVLHGAGGCFCAGADLKALAGGERGASPRMATGRWGRRGSSWPSR